MALQKGVPIIFARIQIIQLEWAVKLKSFISPIFFSRFIFHFTVWITLQQAQLTLLPLKIYCIACTSYGFSLYNSVSFFPQHRWNCRFTWQQKKIQISSKVQRNAMVHDAHQRSLYFSETRISCIRHAAHHTPNNYCGERRTNGRKLA